MPVTAMKARRVYVLVDCLSRSKDYAIALDGDGDPVKTMGDLCIVNGRLGVRGYALAESDGRHLVRFVNGTEGWFHVPDPLQWEDTPTAA